MKRDGQKNQYQGFNVNHHVTHVSIVFLMRIEGLRCYLC